VGIFRTFLTACVFIDEISGVKTIVKEQRKKMHDLEMGYKSGRTDHEKRSCNESPTWFKEKIVDDSRGRERCLWLMTSSG
jgi:hypothetical protein